MNHAGLFCGNKQKIITTIIKQRIHENEIDAHKNSIHIVSAHFMTNYLDDVLDNASIFHNFFLSLSLDFIN